MEDQNQFLELLKELVEIARVEERDLTKEEIKTYFSNMSLSKEQYDLIYDYISKGSIPGDETPKVKTKEKLVESPYVKQYKKDINLIPTISEDEKLQLYKEYLFSHKDLKKNIIECNLKRVIRLAKKHCYESLFLDEMIQEGNLALLSAVDSLKEHDFTSYEDDKLVKACERYLNQQIEQEMMKLVEQEDSNADMEQSILAKTTLIHQATEHLAEELGRVATIEELSDFTKITKEEIQDIIDLSLDAVKVGNGES